MSLPVSMKPAMHALPVSLTPVKLFKTVKVSLTGVVGEYSKKIEIVTRLVYWGQEKLFEEKN
jgi:hypothetical protein